MCEEETVQVFFCLGLWVESVLLWLSCNDLGLFQSGFWLGASFIFIVSFMDGFRVFVLEGLVGEGKAKAALLNVSVLSFVEVRTQMAKEQSSIGVVFKD